MTSNPIAKKVVWYSAVLAVFGGGAICAFYFGYPIAGVSLLAIPVIRPGFVRYNDGE